MDFPQVVTVTGMKASKGDFEGTSYDSTKVYVLTDMDESKGTAKGYATVEYAFEKSDEYEKFKHLTFPFKADCMMRIVTSGKAQKTILLAVKPVAAAKA